MIYIRANEILFCHNQHISAVQLGTHSDGWDRTARLAVESVNQEMSQMDSRIADANRVIEEQATRMGELKRDIEVLTAYLVDKGAIIEDQRAKINELQTKVFDATADQDFASLAELCKSQEAENKLLNARIAELSAERDDPSGRLDTLKGEWLKSDEKLFSHLGVSEQKKSNGAVMADEKYDREGEFFKALVLNLIRVGRTPGDIPNEAYYIQNRMREISLEKTA